MHLLTVHRVHGVGGDDHAEVAVRRLEGRAEDARGRVDAGDDQRVGAERPAQDELEVGRVERAVALLAADDEVPRVVELGHDLRARAPGEVVSEDPLPRLGRIVVDGLPEGVRGDLGRVAVLGDHVDDGHPAGAQLGEERGRPLDDGPAARGRQRKRRDRRVEVAAVHVDRDGGGGARVQPDHGARDT